MSLIKEVIRAGPAKKMDKPSARYLVLDRTEQESVCPELSTAVDHEVGMICRSVDGLSDVWYPK